VPGFCRDFATHWSLVLSASEGESPQSAAALENFAALTAIVCTPSSRENAEDRGIAISVVCIELMVF
jgi:hypothetical protein